jgi:drug/metabolite transporter (DMT)-like permease
MIPGILLGLAASACWALANVAVQRTAKLVGVFRGLLWSQILGGLVAVALSPLADVRVAPVSAADIAWVGVAGASGLLAYLCLFYGLEHGRLTVAVPIMSSWAVLSTALSLVMFDHRPGLMQLAGGGLALVGAVVVSRYAQRDGTAVRGAETGRWLLASVGAAVGFGVMVPAIGRVVPAFGSLGVIGVAYAADLALGLPLALAFRINLAPPTGSAWLPVFLAGLFEAAGFAFIALGGRVAPLAIVSPFASLASGITVAFAWIALRERPAPGVLLGAALVCAGVVVLAL